jgi:hypothetical protein
VLFHICERAVFTLTKIIISSLHWLRESSLPASSVIVSLSIFFLVYLCLVFRMVDIYMPVVKDMKLWFCTAAPILFGRWISYRSWRTDLLCVRMMARTMWGGGGRRDIVPEVPKMCPPPGTLLALWEGRVVCMRYLFILDEIWTQDKIYIYFCRHFAWLKYFTYQLLPILAPNYKQHNLSPYKISFLSSSQHAD